MKQESRYRKIDPDRHDETNDKVEVKIESETQDKTTSKDALLELEQAMTEIKIAVKKAEIKNQSYRENVTKVPKQVRFDSNSDEIELGF